MDLSIANHKQHIDDINEQLKRKYNANISVNERSEVNNVDVENVDTHYTNDSINNIESIRRLEQRIDNLEDHSRRDNLLFYGFPEYLGENCTLRIKEVICNKILNDSVHAKDIKFVRAHRLGKYNGRNAKPRPIIVKFREYNERMDVFMSKKKLRGTQENKNFRKTKFQILSILYE